jgi:predicted alpha/beta superfamily hydrolase
MLRIVCRHSKALILFWILILVYQFGFSQFTIRFQIIERPSGHLADSIFVAGNFNGWNPGINGVDLLKENSKPFIEINNLSKGDYQFKFTRGNWQAVESKKNGQQIENRTCSLTADTVIKIVIENWQDDFPAVVRQHTITSGVQIMDTAFPMPQFQTTRKIWLYLPPDYLKNKKYYPVMYMQDGQNIFDSYTSAFGEWGVDECADSLIKMGKPGCIIVGIENGPNRMNEYNPYDFKEFGKGTGDLYIDFIIKGLKPYIDKHYRTLPTPENTIIAGSSMGGLISYYAMLKHPEVFGKGGIFSPAFWTASGIKELTDSAGKNLNGTIFFYVGGKEDDENNADMKTVIDLLGKNSHAFIYSVIDPDGMHNETAWHKWFHEFYKWVLANGFNNVIDLEDD